MICPTCGGRVAMVQIRSTTPFAAAICHQCRTGVESPPASAWADSSMRVVIGVALMLAALVAQFAR